MPALVLGIIADRTEYIDQISALLPFTQHRLKHSLLLQGCSLPLETDVDIWLVRVTHFTNRTDEVLAWLSDHEIPALIDDVNDERMGHDDAAATTLSNKLLACFSTHQNAGRYVRPPKHVWVLAASTGGPEAIFRFLSALGNKTSDNAYIYAQHIAANAIAPLIKSLQAVTPLHVSECQGGTLIEAGGLYVVSPDREFDIQAGRRFLATSRGWKGEFKPSINQVISKVARAFPARASAVVFSGMCDDGADAVRLISATGGRILVQAFDECAVDSMPREVTKTGCVDFAGTVLELAAYISGDIQGNRRVHSIS